MNILTSVFQFFQHSTKLNVEAREWLVKKGIDLNKAHTGFDNGKHHRGQKSEYLKQCVKADILLEHGKAGFSSFSKGKFVFPLKDKKGEINNFYALAGNNKSEGEYLYENTGFYPQLPPLETHHLIITENILDAAVLCSKENSDARVLALDNGVFSDRFRHAILQLADLTHISFGRYFNDAVKKHIKEFVTEHVGAMEFTDYATQSIIKIEEEKTNDLFLTNVKETETKNKLNTSDPEQMVITAGNLELAVLGGVDEKLDELRVTLRITRTDIANTGYRDTVNLYQRKQMAALINEASDVLLIEPSELEIVINLLTKEVEYYRERQREIGKAMSVKLGGDLSAVRKQDALDYLSQPDLTKNLKMDLQNIGIAGEENNILLLYLAMTSRKLQNPLNIILHAQSGAGKSALMEAVAQCIPQNDYIEITSISQKGFYHWDEHALSHKALLIQDWFALEPEIEYIIREIQSKKKVSRVLTMRDKNNMLVSTVKEVFGPVSVISATTKDSVYEDNANRSIELYLNEDSAQDQKIIERQLNLAAGKVDTQKEETIKARLQDTQNLLTTYPVKNMYAPYLKLPDNVQHIRRVTPIYLSLIEVITLYHQFQREKESSKAGQKEYLLTAMQDIEIANELMLKILLSRTDLLPQATREYLEKLKHWANKNKREEFVQREISRALRTHPSKIKRHTKTLLDLGYLSITGGDRYKKGFSYRVSDENEYQQMQSVVLETLHNSMNEIKVRFQ